ncbi:MAG: hypothetical protein PHR68_01840 [Candidatus Gracilibacteria bacterium]|nr:hypothetical protein [Candidatus Gracilibacteria bacterium]
MKNNNIAFTLAELIVVIGIIGIIGVFSFGSFDKFSSEQYLKNNISSIKSEIKDFDYNVKNLKIYDYKMIFQTGSLAFVTYSNYFNQNYKRLLDFNNYTLNGSMFSSGFSSSGTDINYIIKTIDKIYGASNFDVLEKKDFIFQDSSKFFIENSYSGTNLNNIQLNYYIYENSLKETQDASKMKLIRIQDIDGNQFSQISLENFNNKKYIKDLSGNILNKVFLIFELGGKEVSLELN